MAKCKNKFEFLPTGSIRLQGEVGKALALSTRNLIMKMDWKQLVEPFRGRWEQYSWCGEFWGKYLRGAIFAAYASRDPELIAVIRETVAELLTTQDADGCISSYALHCREQAANVGWDLWGRKYVLLALTRYYQYIEADPKVLEACCRMVDDLMNTVGPGKIDILDTGTFAGMASTSILGAIVAVYRISGNTRYLDFAKWIVSRGAYKGRSIYQDVLDGVAPKDIGTGKAYEMTSCIMGLGELCLECDDYADAMEILMKYYRSVLEREICVTGLGGGVDAPGEYWNDSALKQNSTDFAVTGSQGETCLMVTWLHYLERIMRLSGDATVADEYEKTLYNGMLGAMTPNGTNFTHHNPTPLAGRCTKVPTSDQMTTCFGFYFHEHDCCRANGHEGLATAVMLAVLKDAESGAPVFNLYEDMEVTVNNVAYTVSGGYPFAESGKVAIRLEMESPAEFSVKLRVPAGEQGAGFASVNGDSYDGVPGSYLEIRRLWRSGDVISLNFDMAPRKCRLDTVPAANFYKCGPLVMAEDSRLAADMEWMLSIATCFRRTAAFDGKALCDYASAGNNFNIYANFQVIFDK
ncbi:MAG: glycoside hydrolase family 127 protein [Victivallales bacterium]|nr:glycoside hydrolase family 127 protein [Victivallales bacterium]